ncbi:hypothetical protein EWW49_20415 [Pseudomonas syringae]|nr:hypothetical protein CCL14_12155 [Pseudomonas syringae]PBP43798.1 hypothetical protein CCL13_18390 [Pseudomonas syringae]PBP78873.1 hypothetical protein CCL20_25775 [Pseudomonas syringae]TFZ35158.1 hypothetical protein EWW49_20415 [Pseudomonas syringae]
MGVPIMCSCADSAGNVGSGSAENPPAIPCGSELARESGGSVMTPSRASSLPRGGNALGEAARLTPATRRMRIQTPSQFFTPHSIPLPHCLPYYCATLAPLALAGTILVLRLFRRGMPLSLAHDFDRMA